MREFKIQYSITSHESQMDRYLNEIGKRKIGLLTAEEEVVLAQKIRAGDQVALERLTKANLRFVVSVAKQYQHQGLTLGDLISEGNLGLIKAAKRFDEKRGFKFISFAVWWIRQSILLALAEDARTVRLPFNQIGRIRDFKKAFSRLEQEYEREPSLEELSEKMKLKVGKVSNTIGYAQRQTSLDAPYVRNTEHSGENTLLDMLDNGESGTDQFLMNQSLKDDLMEAVKKLNRRDQIIIIDSFGLGISSPISLEQIAENLNLTGQRVTQIRKKALEKLFKIAKGTILESYFYP